MIGKDNRLIVHSRQPVVMGTPDELLAQHLVTRPEAIFVRNNFDVPDLLTMRSRPLAGWSISFVGLEGDPQTLAAEHLADWPQAEATFVLQCSGNSRSLFGELAPVPGTPWGRGGLANVTMAGVKLSTVVERLGLKIDPQARYLTAEGFDAPVANKPDFEHSVPLDEALERGFLAIRLGDQPLPAVHGGPVRLVMPGFYGTTHIKWLSRLRFEASETTNHFQVPQYRTPRRMLRPGEPFEFTLDNSDPTWHMRVASRIFAPTPTLRVKGPQVVASGVAWTDGTPLAAIELSSDAGHTWLATDWQPPASPWAWTAWSRTVELTPGQHTLMSRAIDVRGRTQPLDGTTTWNPNGYCWNVVDRVAFEVT